MIETRNILLTLMTARRKSDKVHNRASRGIMRFYCVKLVSVLNHIRASTELIACACYV